ncbi:hypothetical protein ACFQX7_11405 [Luedemannella flava]
MVTADTAWEFVYDGEVWEARCAPPCEANVSIAVETLIVGFGTRAWSVEDFLRIWDEKIATEGVGFTLNVVAATVAQVTPTTSRSPTSTGSSATCACRRPRCATPWAR